MSVHSEELILAMHGAGWRPH